MIMLSFDTEEFDVPREHGVEFSLEDGMKVSRVGIDRILDVLERNGVKATFFCTANFAENAPEQMKRIVAGGHEVACHGCDHFNPKPTDFAESKARVEAASGVKSVGYRQPRMFPVIESEIKRAGYLYNSSLNPAFIPGRYMHLTTPRTWFMKDGVMQIPASVSPWFRIPLFWISLHNFPEWLYMRLARRVWHHDGYFNTYFHPWEFYELKEHPEFKMPYIIKNNSGIAMQERLEHLIQNFKALGARFITYREFAESRLKA